jgi:hypothetical protein
MTVKIEPRPSLVPIAGLLLLLLPACSTVASAWQAAKANATESNVCLEAFNLREKACERVCASITDKKKMAECMRSTPACVFVAPCVAYALSKDSAQKPYFGLACIANLKNDPACHEAVEEAANAHEDLERVLDRAAVLRAGSLASQPHSYEIQPFGLGYSVTPSR